MISYDDLAQKSANQIRSSDALSVAFDHYFKEEFGRNASFCCTFKDYDLLFRRNPNKILMKATQYTVSYDKNFVLAYRGKDGKVYRTLAKNASDDFLADFLKLHAKAHFPHAKERIVKIEQEKKEDEVKETPKKTTKKSKESKK